MGRPAWKVKDHLGPVLGKTPGISTPFYARALFVQPSWRSSHEPCTLDFLSEPIEILASQQAIVES